MLWGMEKKLLDLTVEYAAAKESGSWGESIPGKPARTLDEIAAEYGQALRVFLAS